MRCYTYDMLEKNGRLGNQLWQIAATINLAEQNDGIARFHPNWEYRNFFSIPNELFTPTTCTETFDGGSEYFQEYHYFEPVADKIREYFAPAEWAAKRVQDEWNNLAIDHRHTCAIHVRRGDYLNHPNHFPIMSHHYFNMAVDSVSEHVEDVQFLVFSDDIEWCKQNKSYLGVENMPVVFVEGVVRPVEVADRRGSPQDWIDLLLMAKCDSHIISNSTFSWWGAYLSDDPSPIYPSEWFGTAVPNWERWEMAIPPGWRKFVS